MSLDFRNLEFQRSQLIIEESPIFSNSVRSQFPDFSNVVKSVALHDDSGFLYFPVFPGDRFGLKQ